MKTGSKYISNGQWKRYNKIISDFIDVDAGRQTIIWAKHINSMLQYAEDFSPQYYKIEIEALVYYNAFRNWPINKSTVTGELDEESLSIYITKKYLEDHGYLNKQGYWDFNWTEDRFIIHGISYRPSGDTAISQHKDDVLIIMLILKRDRDSIIRDQDMYDPTTTQNQKP